MTPKIPLLRQMAKNTVRLDRMLWKEQRGAMILVAAAYLMLALTPFVLSGATGLLLNELFRSAGMHSGASLAISVITAFIVANALLPLMALLETYASKLFWFYLEEKFEVLMLRKMGEIDIAVHEDPVQKDLLNVVTENAYKVRNFADRQFSIMQDIAGVVVATVILAVVEWWIPVLIFAGTAFQLWAGIRYGNQVWSIYGSRAEIHRKYFSLRSHFYSLTELTELKLYGNVERMTGMINQLFRNFRAEERTAERKKLTWGIAASLISQVAFAIAILWFVSRVFEGALLAGTFAFILGSIERLQGSLSAAFMNVARQYEDGLFLNDQFRVLDTAPAVPKPEHGIILDAARTPEIVFEDVSFSYPNTGTLVLDRCSLTIRAGEKVALVGINGSGKTTLVKLLCRFYDPTGGRILIDGHDLREIDLKSWHTHLGVLFQEYAHYSMPVNEAIAMGDANRPLVMDDVAAAASMSESDAFIRSWPNKYNQMLGREFHEGIEPSVGQWQKLALARIFYRDSRILVLDEPTASIDAEAEAHVFEKLESLSRDKTVILISHRFSTVRNADTIYVIKDGRVEESGSHQKLLKHRGQYAKLFALQAKGYK